MSEIYDFQMSFLVFFSLFQNLILHQPMSHIRQTSHTLHQTRRQKRIPIHHRRQKQLPIQIHRIHRIPQRRQKTVQNLIEIKKQNHLNQSIENPLNVVKKVKSKVAISKLIKKKKSKVLPFNITPNSLFVCDLII